MTFPDDPSFQRFAARIADAVMRAEENGWKVHFARRPGCCCPLGAVRDGHRRPSDGLLNVSFPPALDIAGVRFEHQIGFEAAFDGNLPGASTSGARLARLYRERAIRMHGATP